MPRPIAGIRAPPARTRWGTRAGSMGSRAGGWMAMSVRASWVTAGHCHTAGRRWNACGTCRAAGVGRPHVSAVMEPGAHAGVARPLRVRSTRRSARSARPLSRTFGVPVDRRTITSNGSTTDSPAAVRSPTRRSIIISAARRPISYAGCAATVRKGSLTHSTGRSSNATTEMSSGHAAARARAAHGPPRTR